MRRVLFVSNTTELALYQFQHVKRTNYTFNLPLLSYDLVPDIKSCQIQSTEHAVHGGPFRSLQ